MFEKQSQLVFPVAVTLRPLHSVELSHTDTGGKKSDPWTSALLCCSDSPVINRRSRDEGFCVISGQCVCGLPCYSTNPSSVSAFPLPLVPCLLVPQLPFSADLGNLQGHPYARTPVSSKENFYSNIAGILVLVKIFNRFFFKKHIIQSVF